MPWFVIVPVLTKIKLTNIQFNISMEFANPGIGSTDVLQDFDFDSFLHQDGGDTDGFSFDPASFMDGGEVVAE